MPEYKVVVETYQRYKRRGAEKLLQSSYFDEKQQLFNRISFSHHMIKRHRTAERSKTPMAYMCLLNHTEECNGCQECERQKKSKEQLRWEKYEEEYDWYRDAEYENYLEREY